MVRTRFAPSPTGYLHIGGVRTALFNWLYARKRKGQFILRIDDTDVGRNKPEALAPILRGFRWLGMDWDEGAEVGGPCGPYYQSEKLDRYQTAVRQLLDKGLAYWDYSTPKDLEDERKPFEAAKQPWVYSRRWMAQTEGDRKRFEAEGRKGAVRLKMPREGCCVINDQILGRVEVGWAQEQDHVVQRADGTVLYNLASVVDDEDMKITHVIRAQEHVSNTPRQVFIAQGLGYQLPEYAHVPAVAEPGSKNKLSKRKIPQYLKNPDFKKLYDHGKCIADQIGLTGDAESFNPVLVEFYEQVGYLPDTILNYLVLLGWSFNDEKEEFTRQQMIDLFSLERVNKASASFDCKKLWAFQERDMNKLDLPTKAGLCAPFVQKAGLPATPERVRQVVQGAAERIKTAGDVLEYREFFVGDDEFSYDEAAFEKRLRKPPEAAGLLRKFRDVLAQATAFDPEALEALLKQFVEREGIQMGQIVHAVRVAITGKGVGFGLFDALAILGKPSSLARIDRVLARL